MRCGVDLDGVLCDLGLGVAERIRSEFGVSSHPDTWRTFDLRRLELGVPGDRFRAFLDKIFVDPHLYEAAPPVEGAVAGVAAMRSAGWSLIGITARPAPLAELTVEWLRRHGLHLEEVHHAAVGEKSAVATAVAVSMTIEDNPEEAELLGEVCESWLIDRPYNRDHRLRRARRLLSWDDAVGRFCQMELFVSEVG